MGGSVKGRKTIGNTPTSAKKHKTKKNKGGGELGAKGEWLKMDGGHPIWGEPPSIPPKREDEERDIWKNEGKRSRLQGTR